MEVRKFVEKDISEDSRVAMTDIATRLGHSLYPGDYPPDRFEEPISYTRRQFRTYGYQMLYILEQEGLIDLDEIQTTIERITTPEDTPETS